MSRVTPTHRIDYLARRTDGPLRGVIMPHSFYTTADLVRWALGMLRSRPEVIDAVIVDLRVESDE